MAKTKKAQTEDAAAVASIQPGSSKDSAKGNKEASVSFESRNVRSAKEKGKKRTVASRAGIVFPPTRLSNKMRKAKLADRIGTGAGVYCAAVLEYLVAEIAELAGNAAHDLNRKVIKPRHIQLAIGHDEEFKKLLGNVTISEGGVLPGINPVLLPNRSPLHLAREKMQEVLSQNGKKKDKEATKKAKADKKKVIAKNEPVETTAPAETTDAELSSEDSDDDNEDVEMSSAVTATASQTAK